MGKYPESAGYYNGPASHKEAGKEMDLMGNNYDVRSGLNSGQVLVNPVMPIRAHSNNDDIEVIDLDDPRGQIKPTTWHR